MCDQPTMFLKLPTKMWQALVGSDCTVRSRNELGILMMIGAERGALQRVGASTGRPWSCVCQTVFLLIFSIVGIKGPRSWLHLASTSLVSLVSSGKLETLDSSLLILTLLLWKSDEISNISPRVAPLECRYPGLQIPIRANGVIFQ